MSTEILSSPTIHLGRNCMEMDDRLGRLLEAISDLLVLRGGRDPASGLGWGCPRAPFLFRSARWRVAGGLAGLPPPAPPLPRLTAHWGTGLVGWPGLEERREGGLESTSDPQGRGGVGSIV